MKRVKKRRRSSPWAPAPRGPFDVGGVPLGGLTHPRRSGRRGGGRLGRKIGAAGKTPAPAKKQEPSPKALARWENEGGSPAPRTTPDRAKNVGAANGRENRRRASR